MKSPYADIRPEAFWSRAVAGMQGLVPSALYRKKWPIDRNTRIATAGSCFAQHIGRNLGKHGFDVMDLEPAPQTLVPAQAHRYGYSLYSARYGNIYTMHQLLQLVREAYGEHSIEDGVWVGKTGAHFDALRPGVEPDGLGSRDEVLAHRAYHLSKVRQMVEGMELFIFTMGLTEAWQSRSDGSVFPTAPGTIAGEYDPDRYVFKNYLHSEVVHQFLAFREFVHARQRQKCRFLLTVSPVPLTATASADHVMVATTFSKAVLRAAAGELAMTLADVDYFPSFEIISNPWGRQMLYEDNLRSVKEEGVDAVMSTFFAEHAPGALTAPASGDDPRPSISAEGTRNREQDAVCEESILDAFSGAGR